MHTNLPNHKPKKRHLFKTLRCKVYPGLLKLSANYEILYQVHFLEKNIFNLKFKKEDYYIKSTKPAQKIKFFIRDFFSKCEQIRSF